MGFLEINVTPAKTYISTQWVWNLPVYFLIKKIFRSDKPESVDTP